MGPVAFDAAIYRISNRTETEYFAGARITEWSISTRIAFNALKCRVNKIFTRRITIVHLFALYPPEALEDIEIYFSRFRYHRNYDDDSNQPDTFFFFFFFIKCIAFENLSILSKCRINWLWRFVALFSIILFLTKLALTLEYLNAQRFKSTITSIF